ncbi:MAG: NAD+ synthase, partial [Candidatus Neomarinimicrobiota bacterium]
FVDRRDSHLYNTAVVVQDGKYVAKYDKVLLPTYDVFDEDRYFESGKDCTPVSIMLSENEVRVGLQICEDLWDADYERKVTDEMVKAGAEIVINISASPFSEGKGLERMELIRSKVDSLGVPFLYCNMVGAQDELVFDGHSVAYDRKANLIAEGVQFEEEIVIVDLDNTTERPVEPLPYRREKELFDGLVLGVRDYFRKTGHRECVIGLSGGIDSALTACIATEALGRENVTCVSMPSPFNSKEGIDDLERLAKNLGVKLTTIRIDHLMAQYETALRKEFEGMRTDIAEQNIQARIRGNILMAISNKLGSLVLSTGNKTELALGYCTLYGDMSGGLAAINDLSKSDVYAVASWYNEHTGNEIIPPRILEKTPSAELAESQVDPFNYDVVSPLVDEIVEHHRNKTELVKMGYDPVLVDRINELLRRAEFKRRQAAPGLRVTSKAFGIGRRYPIVNHFKQE